MWKSSVADIEIGNVQLRCRGVLPDGATTLRLRVDHLLGTADVRPAGMSPSAVLVVRRLPDPLPGAFAAHQPRVRVDRSWEEAAKAALAAMYQRAVRPVGGVIPAGAEAVLFDDEAQMLAHLAIDIRDDRVHEHWWWRELPQSMVPSPFALDRVLRQRPELVPAIMHHLAMLDRLGTVVESLSAAQAMSVVAAVLRAYDIAWPVSEFQAPTTSDGGDAGEELWRDVRTIWDRWAPPTFLTRAVQRERACLVVVALGLFHAPAVIRNQAFQQRVRAWWVNMADEGTAGEGAHASVRTGLREASVVRRSRLLPTGDDRVVDVQTVEAGIVDEAGGNWRATSEAPIRRSSIESHADRPIDAGTASLPTSSHLDIIQVEGEMASGHAGDSAVDQVGPDAVEVGESNDRDDAIGLTLAGGIQTELGGIAYLINLMCRFDLPDSFEDEWRLATTAGPWGTLELLARAFAGQAAGDLAGDPLWPALARLAGRQVGTLPGLGGSVKEPAGLPEDWISRFAGVGPIQAVPIDAPLLRGVDALAGRWMRLVVPYLRAYLEDLLSDENDPGRWLLLQPGQVYISSTHVDVVLPLEAISIPLRLAGLDRDPGWLPDFGRVVKIHFS